MASEKVEADQEAPSARAYAELQERHPLENVEEDYEMGNSEASPVVLAQVRKKELPQQRASIVTQGSYKSFLARDYYK